MSVDFYAVVPASSWPTAVQMRQCIAGHAYPLTITRFPVARAGVVVNDGTLAVIDGRDAYLEGEVAAVSSIPADMQLLNDRLAASGSVERIKPDQIIMSFRVRSPSEMRAASYVLSALIVCFHGLGIETQGNTSGRAGFAQGLIAGAEALKSQ